MRYLLGEGHLERKQGRWVMGLSGDEVPRLSGSLGLPQSLDELLMRRLQALSSQALQVVQAAATLGRAFRIDVLAATTELDDIALMARLAEARERHVVEPSGAEQFHFLHDKLREASYASVEPARVRDLHARAARALSQARSQTPEVPSLSAELARHYRLAGNLAEAIEHLERASFEATALSAQRDAAAHLAQALKLSEEVEDISLHRKARWHRLIGGALHDVGELEGGNLHLQQALVSLGEPAPFQSTPGLALGIATELGRQVLHRLLGWHRRVGASTAPERELECARCLDRLQQAYYYSGDALPMAFACLRTLNLAESAPPSPELSIAYANAYAVAGVIPSRSLASIYHGQATKTLRVAHDAVAATYFLTLQGVYLIGVCAWDEAESVIEQGLAGAEKLNFGRRRRELIGLSSTLQFYRANFRRGVQHADALRSLALKADVHTYCWAILCRAQALLCEGSIEAALVDIQSALAIVASLGRPERIWCRALEAVLRARSGEWRLADEASRAALDEIQRIPTVTVYTIDAYARTAEVRLALHERAAPAERSSAQRLARLAVRALGKLARVFPLARPRHELLQGALARAGGQRRRAAWHFRRSVAAAESFGLPYDAGRAALALARIDGNDDAIARARERLHGLGADEDIASI